MKKIYITLCLFLISLSTMASENKILLIAVDELTRDWLSSYGSANKTPILDKMADKGLRFTTNWQTSTDKVKVEKSFFTGSYKGSGTPFPALLKKAGYKTYYLGNASSKTLLRSESSIHKAGFSFYSINSGLVKNFVMKESLAKSVTRLMGQAGKTFILARFSSSSLKSKNEYVQYIAEIEKFLNGIDPLLQSSSKCTVIFTAISGTKNHEKMNTRTDKKTVRNPFAKNKKFKEEKLAVKDVDIRLPLIIKSPLIPEVGLYTKDLIDSSDIGATIVDLAGIKQAQKGNAKSFKPAICGSLNPLLKKNWIYCEAGSDKLIRSWHYVYYVSDKIYGINADPEQKMNLLVGKNNDKHYAGERVRLKMIYERDFLGIKPKVDQLIKIETLEK